MIPALANEVRTPLATRVIIMGAAGRDFHNFNTVFRGDPTSHVVAFTATQIPNIEGRVYPPELAGPLYPQGIPIFPEERLTDLIRETQADDVVFAYSDTSHETVMHKASQVLAAGASFRLIGPRATMLPSRVPVVSVCAVRTGSGKSQTTRRVVSILREKGRRVVSVRHPMPYGDLVRQRVQRFAHMEDLDRERCTIEEREEYEPHIQLGSVVYAGVDYGAILAEAEKEADVIVWDGGNNDLPFFEPRLEIVVADPHRPGHEVGYHPGEANLRRAHVVVINKIDTAGGEGVAAVRRSIRATNPRAVVVDAASPIFVDDPAAIAGKRVLAVEDGPTLTHGEMAYGAGVLAAQRFGAAEVIDPRPYVVGSIARTFAAYPGIGPLLPAMGYGAEQTADLEATIARTPADLVLIATPVDLRRVLRLDRPSQRVRYELQEIGRPDLKDVLTDF
jgi:predicted GTPase